MTSHFKMTGVAGTGFVLVQGATDFRSQCDYINIVQILWLLYMFRIPASRIVAFIVNMIDDNLGLCAHPGKPRLTIPPGYESCV
jgi:hypothetical protein